MKKLLIVGTAVGIAVAAISAANAQSWGRGGAYAGADPSQGYYYYPQVKATLAGVMRSAKESAKGLGCYWASEVLEPASRNGIGSMLRELLVGARRQSSLVTIGALKAAEDFSHAEPA